MNYSAEYYLLESIRNLDQFEVPFIGTFYRVFHSARIEAGSSSLLHPPFESPAFKPSLSSDDSGEWNRFCQYLQPTGKDAAELGKEIQRVLEQKGSYHIQGIGVLTKGLSGIEMNFLPSAKEVLYSNLGGMPTLTLPKLTPARVSATPTPQPKPVAVAAPEPIIAEKVEAPTPVATVTETPIPVPTAPITPKNQVEKKPGKKMNRKRVFRNLLISCLLIGLLYAAWWYYSLPVTHPEVIKVSEVKPEEPAPVEKPATPVVEARVESYLIVFSSPSEAAAEEEKLVWIKKGIPEAKVIPPAAGSKYYRVSIAGSEDRKSLIPQMIQLKQENIYSWILLPEQP
ncbi:MAG: hypothetical protein EBS07_06435 [Sphingobacteriia bacterium]|nr:hypothetical protein [Sphingobacteriia bacterium]